MRKQSVSNNTLFTALRQIRTVSSCQSLPPISILSILLEQTKIFNVNLHTLIPRLSTSAPYPLSCQPINFLQIETQSFLS